MAEVNNGSKFLGGGFGQVLVTVLSALVMTLMAWAWNLTQDVRVLMEARPTLSRLEQITEQLRQNIEVNATRMTRVEQTQLGRERSIVEVYDNLHELDTELSDLRAELSAQRATLQFLARNHNGRPPVER